MDKIEFTLQIYKKNLVSLVAPVLLKETMGRLIDKFVSISSLNYKSRFNFIIDHSRSASSFKMIFIQIDKFKRVGE